LHKDFKINNFILKQMHGENDFIQLIWKHLVLINKKNGGSEQFYKPKGLHVFGEPLTHSIDLNFSFLMKISV